MRVQEIRTADHQKRYVVVDASGNLVVPVARYLKYLHAIGRARNTLRAFAYSLSLYFTYMEQQHLEYQQVSLDDLAGFVLWLKNPYRSLKVLPVQPVTQARTNTTINGCLTAVAGFYDYLWRQDELSTDLNEKTRTYLLARARSYKSFLHHLAKGKLIEKNLLKQRVPRQGQHFCTRVLSASGNALPCGSRMWMWMVARSMSVTEANFPTMPRSRRQRAAELLMCLLISSI